MGSAAKAIWIANACCENCLLMVQIVVDHNPKMCLSWQIAVYKEVPWHLKEQMAEAMAHVRAHPEACPSDIPVR